MFAPSPVIILVIYGALLPFGTLAKTLPLALKEGIPAKPLQLKHISRTAEAIPQVPMVFAMKHLPCDMDQRGGQSYMSAFPRQCVWAYNNRYRSESNYRIYKTYQLEAFFFGQYYERLKRYELEPHTFDYN